MNIYDVTYLKTVKRCKYGTLYTSPPKAELPGVSILKLQLE
jgi:hypothetical protein